MTVDTPVGDGRVLEDLARRCEEAAEPDRELDTAIAVAGSGFEPVTRKDRVVVDRRRGTVCPRYTASLDAAMTLVPENADAAGERYRLEAYNSPGVLAPHIRASAWVAGAPRVYAGTPALALCAAALRARALSQPMEDENG